MNFSVLLIWPEAPCQSGIVLVAMCPRSAGVAQNGVRSSANAAILIVRWGPPRGYLYPGVSTEGSTPLRAVCTALSITRSALYSFERGESTR